MLYHERQVAKPSLLEEVRSLVYAHRKPSMSCYIYIIIFNLFISHTANAANTLTIAHCRDMIKFRMQIDTMPVDGKWGWQLINTLDVYI